MRAFFTIEALFSLFLLPYLFYLSDPYPPILPRETAEVCNDIAQIYSYNISLDNFSVPGYIFWIDGRAHGNCSYVFRYCTSRYTGIEVRICAAECLQ